MDTIVKDKTKYQELTNLLECMGQMLYTSIYLTISHFNVSNRNENRTTKSKEKINFNNETNNDILNSVIEIFNIVANSINTNSELTDSFKIEDETLQKLLLFYIYVNNLNRNKANKEIIINQNINLNFLEKLRIKHETNEHKLQFNKFKSILSKLLKEKYKLQEVKNCESNSNLIDICNHIRLDKDDAYILLNPNFIKINESFENNTNNNYDKKSVKLIFFEENASVKIGIKNIKNQISKLFNSPLTILEFDYFEFNLINANVDYSKDEDFTNYIDEYIKLKL